MSQQLDAKTEQALVNYLLTLGLPTANVVTGESSADEDLQVVECIAEPGGDEEPAYSGNFWKDAVVVVKTAAAREPDGVDPKPSHDALVAAVEAGLLTDGLPAALSAAIADFTCIAFLPQGPAFTTQGDVWSSEVRLRLYVCNSSLPA